MMTLALSVSETVASLIYDARVIIYNRNMLIIQATGARAVLIRTITLRNMSCSSHCANAGNQHVVNMYK
jgi:hypothetical protein